eukprot:TRINITY_DN4116_c0_g1_i2.p1 TRINITY_DN4116_c0_g1~~TRINITY_DN4116_c0_g1_i2.p1  ORF type:complete len:696 (-),score=189.71 TRINITY_DN4116_c0_g1_i2:202-2151(-)
MVGAGAGTPGAESSAAEAQAAALAAAAAATFPVTLSVHVVEARDLPVMDMVSALADAYVEVKFGEASQKTPTTKNTLNPVWRSKFQLALPKVHLLQDHPLELRVWDKDVFSANDVIGSVHLDMSALLTPSPNPRLSEWFPIYDTLRGLRGELRAKIVAVTNMEKAEKTSSSVQFFACSLPRNAEQVELIGLVEELLVKEDPESHWSDPFRKSRNSNDARQFLLCSHAGRLRRQIGRKVKEKGGNAVLGYRQHLDLEGDYIVARGCGTAARIHHKDSNKAAVLAPSTRGRSAKDIPLLTIVKFLPGTIVHHGGLVAARLVKLSSKEKFTKTRDKWWEEAREEIRKNAAALCCTHVVGYYESVTFSEEEDVCIVSAVGTAVVMGDSAPAHSSRCGFCHVPYPHDSTPSVPLPSPPQVQPAAAAQQVQGVDAAQQQVDPPQVGVTHQCALCLVRQVPDVILSTTEPPSEVPVVGCGQFMEVRVCRTKQKSDGESAALQVSSMLPFLEYELNKQVVSKLKILGMNAVLGLHTDVTCGNTMLTGIASGTAVFLAPLSPPLVMSIMVTPTLDDTRQSSDALRMDTLRKKIEDTSKLNVERFKSMAADAVAAQASNGNKPPLSPEPHRRRAQEKHKRDKRQEKAKRPSDGPTSSSR